MENENEQAQEEVVEQEEQTSEETTEETQEETQEEENDSITLSKAEYTKLNRQAIAYKAIKAQPEKKAPVQTSAIPSERIEKLELLADGYSKDEVDAIMELGGTKVLGSKLVQSAIQLMRKEKKSNDAKVVPNSKAPIYKKFTQEDMNKMSASEMEKILQGN